MADIVLKNRSGDAQTYSGVETVELATADGGTQIYTAGTAKIKTGAFTPGEDDPTTVVRHGLGAVPDLVIVFNQSMPTESYYAVYCWGLSARMISQVNQLSGGRLDVGSSPMFYGDAPPITANDNAQAFVGAIRGATEDTFTVGSAYKFGGILSSQYTYTWIALAFG